ncbi:DUF4401 domain-containing protein [Desulfogranum japonicum]|uniref:DUF4401 domain-containing protein n=1 Tax=Desulfogranum japonicum TaxID=231447 RepID=UPI000404E94F|nr:DUF4401 domain-containing protein [Desulfogranum japonicum]
MNKSTNQTWTLLQKHGIVQGKQPEHKAPDAPWYVKVLLAFSGWLAALFILGFIGTAFASVFRNSEVACIVGALMIVGAFVQLRLSVNEFVEHTGLATSMAGQVLLAFAIFDFSDHNKVMAWLLLVALQAVLVVLMRSFIHRVFSTIAASVALAMALYEMQIPDVIGGILLFAASWCWLNEFRYPQLMPQIRAIGYGLVLALVSHKALSLFGYRSFGHELLAKHAALSHPWLGEALIGVVTIYVAWRVLHRYGQPLKSRLSMTTLLATLLISLVSLNVQGITVGMVIIVFGFLGANRILFGLGIASLLFYISSYYYLLDTTLLAKSQSLLVTGLILLFVRWVMQYIIPTHNEA